MFASIPEVLEDLARGEPIVLVDDADRENEGDLVVAAQFATPEVINFMARHGRGLICLALDGQYVDRLQLPMMASHNESRFGTAFTVSIEARHGVTTGISAADRARTIAAAIHDDASPQDIVTPGHVFPIRARKGGVLVRAGQTEGSVDLARLAGLKPAGVICEIMSEDGTMARRDELADFCQLHGIKMVSVADIIEYRRRREKLVNREVSVSLPTRFGEFRLHLYKSLLDDTEHLALCAGRIGDKDAPADLAGRPVLVRVHSECLTGDLLGSLRCDCGHQLHNAMKAIHDEGLGAVLYMRQEGRGIGLANKLHAYRLQEEEGMDTVEANTALGFAPDLRDYGIGAQILVDLGIRKIRLMTNNPAKVVALEGYGLEIVDRVPLEGGVTDTNLGYLKTKRDKMGHLLDNL
jgi:3,4-dihydroxy 2-butanone 4-phosphate synthase/GTP cyclohydrolase II